MGQIRRSYGTASKTVLQVACASGYCTHESIAAWISARIGEAITPSMVAQWAAGLAHPPGDVILLVLEHVAVPEQVQHLVQVWLAGITFSGRIPVLLLEPQERPGGDVVQEVLAVGSALGRVQARVAEAMHPRSPGGRRLTPDEQRALHEEARALARTALHLVADLES